jgi:F0F1-type ATP synthase assembly protein I
VDYRFQYRRHKPAPEELEGQKRREKDALIRARGLAIGLSIPMSLAAGPLGGWLLGSWLDRLFHTGFLTLTLILLGTVAGLKMTVDMLAKLSRDA